MKKFRISVLALMMALAVMLVPSMKAEAAEVEPGSKVTVSFQFANIQSLDSRISYSNRDLFDSVTVSHAMDMSGSATESAVCINGDGSNKSGSVKVTVEVPADAQVGDKCTITLGELFVTDASGNYVELASRSEVVEVVDEVSTETEEKPAVDTEALEEQILFAEVLSNDGYTKESWDALLTALANGRDMLLNGDQSEVDAATQALKDALAGLAKIDYSKLQAAIDDANALISSDENAQLWNKLLAALNNGTSMLTSDDQASVDAAAEEIQAALAEIKALLAAANEAGGDDVVEEPAGEYCNIPMHKVWPILFFISLIANIVLVILLVRMNNEKKKTNDDTPLVDYEIGDDE